MTSVSHESSGLQSSMIFINSRSNNVKIINNDYSDIIYYFHSNLSCSDGFVFLISLCDAIIPVSWYTISSFNNNNSLVYSINSINTTYVIPDGNYTVLDLYNLFVANLPFTISYDSISNKFTFVHSTYNFILLSTSTCFELIGLSDGVNHNSSSFILVFDNQVDLCGTRCLYICTNLQTLNLDSRIGTLSSNILAKIPVNVDNNNLITHYNYNGFRSLLSNRLINNIQIRIEDDRGRLVNIKNHYSLSIEFHVIPEKVLVYQNQLMN